MLKKIGILILSVLLFSSGAAMAAGAVTQGAVQKEIANVRTLTFTCVGDASNGSIPDEDTTAANTRDLIGWELWKVQAIYGVTGPTDNSDVYIKDSNGVDLMGGYGENMLDNAAHNEAPPRIDGVASLQPVDGTLTLDVDNQSVNSATYVIKLFFRRGQK